ncbi:protein of unknown function [Pedobacter antarcticus]|nr:protein of unknown function [Pedobacter antarcticus]
MSKKQRGEPMNQLKNILPGLISLLTIVGCGQSGKENEMGTTTLPADTNLGQAKRQTIGDKKSVAAEQIFLEETGRILLLELELSNVSLQRASHPELKAYTEKMMGSTRKFHEQLQQLATSLSYQLPGALPSRSQLQVDEIKKLEGQGFDLEYIKSILELQHKTLDNLHGAIRFKKGPVQEFANHQLEGVNKMLDETVIIDSLIKKVNPDQPGDDLLRIDRKHIK